MTGVMTSSAVFLGDQGAGSVQRSALAGQQGDAAMLSVVCAAPGLAQDLRETCHDMRQPVASVFALAAAAMAEPGLPQAARARLELIVEQAECLADLVQHSLVSSGRAVWPA